MQVSEQQTVDAEKLVSATSQAEIIWPPKPWQRVEVVPQYRIGGTTGLGTVLEVSAHGFAVLLDGFRSPAVFSTSAKLRPADEKAPGWVPIDLYKQYLLDWSNPQAVDMKLHAGTYAFNCWPKRKPPLNFCYFLEMDIPYRQYTEHEVAAVRPEGA